jgi:hypothetical protein
MYLMSLYTQYFCPQEVPSELTGQWRKNRPEHHLENEAIARLQSTYAAETLQRIKQTYHLERRTFL